MFEEKVVTQLCYLFFLNTFIKIILYVCHYRHSGRRPTPICLPLPGGFSRFCGRIYGISRRADDFQACLGLELRADDEVEAALRVSCFKFGPRGLQMTEAQPLPPAEADSDEGKLISEFEIECTRQKKNDLILVL